MPMSAHDVSNNTMIHDCSPAQATSEAHSRNTPSDATVSPWWRDAMNVTDINDYQDVMEVIEVIENGADEMLSPVNAGMAKDKKTDGASAVSLTRKEQSQFPPLTAEMEKILFGRKEQTTTLAEKRTRQVALQMDSPEALSPIRKSARLHEIGTESSSVSNKTKRKQKKEIMSGNPIGIHHLTNEARHLDALGEYIAINIDVAKSKVMASCLLLNDDKKKSSVSDFFSQALSVEEQEALDMATARTTSAAENVVAYFDNKWHEFFHPNGCLKGDAGIPLSRKINHGEDMAVLVDKKRMGITSLLQAYGILFDDAQRFYESDKKDDNLLLSRLIQHAVASAVGTRTLFPLSFLHADPEKKALSWRYTQVVKLIEQRMRAQKATERRPESTQSDTNNEGKMNINRIYQLLQVQTTRADMFTRDTDSVALYLSELGLPRG